AAVGTAICATIGVTVLRDNVVVAEADTVSPPAAAIASPTPEPAAIGQVLTQPAQAITGSALVSNSRGYAKETTALLAEPAAEAAELATVDLGDKLTVAAETAGEYQRVTADGQEGWIPASLIMAETPELAAGIIEEPCNRNKAGFEKKLLTSTIRIYRSVCALFPDINSIGGWRAGGRAFHKNGRALDFMVTPKKESELGWRIAKYLVKNAKEFHIDHIIFEQKIWTPSSPTWRKMADRGSITENHYNHVHVAVVAGG
ncbi:MAG: SH3 domain-containing protein, partial [Propionibacteriaceae bacterium]|nr:SH3 domain-containing protein [Propionibacteriaceae bacterium]